MIQQGIREQFRRNSVALISLFIAVTGLLYNTWRNEHSEYNRNQRWASLEVLLTLGELHQTWGKNFEGLERHDRESKEAIEREIASLRSDTLAALRELD